MTIGIYKLNFGTDFYIGQSVNILARMEQHEKRLMERTAARKLQIAYNSCGSFTFEILAECHPDFLDLLENYYIQELDPVLNTSRPKSLLHNFNASDIDIILDNSDKSLAYLALNFTSLAIYISKLEELVELLKDARSDKELAYDTLHRINKAETTAVTLSNEVARLKRRGLFARIFNT